MLSREDLRVYQRRAVKFLKINPESGLFLDMGLGKTVSTQTALADLLDDCEIGRVLVVGPLRVVQGVWEQESRQWEHLRHLSFKLIEGNEGERLQCLKSKASIHLINVENFRWLLYTLKSVSRRKGFVWPYDTLVIDESSMFKSAKAKRFNTLRYMLWRFDRRHILTGTPSPNGIEDVWSQMMIVDKGKRLGTSIKRFRSRFCTPGGYMGRKHIPDENASEKVAQLIAPAILTLRAEDWLDLPPLISTEVWVDLPPKARKIYETLEKEMFIQLDKGDAVATHAATLTSKCHQLANGAVYVTDEEGQKQWQHIHDAKLHALDEVLNETSCNSLVAYYFGHDLERLTKKHPKAPVISEVKNQRELNALQRDWNAKKHPVMFIHPQGTGHGLNLQDGGHSMVFFSLLFGHEPYRQVMERMGQARQVGKAAHVLRKHILVRDTVDEVLLAAQVRKFDNERGFIKSIKEYRDVKNLLR
jgi:SNF2 family DNA or RNA helicase